VEAFQMKKHLVTVSVDLTELRRNLPPVVARKKLDQYLGGIISKEYMANLDSQGEGPPRIKFGKNVGYLRDPLVDWLQSRVRPDNDGGGQ
jgi:hypothetical protein